MYKKESLRTNGEEQKKRTSWIKYPVVLLALAGTVLLVQTFISSDAAVVN